MPIIPTVYVRETSDGWVVSKSGRSYQSVSDAAKATATLKQKGHPIIWLAVSGMGKVALALNGIS